MGKNHDRHKDTGTDTDSRIAFNFVLQGGESNIIWSELRGGRLKTDACEPERCAEHDSRTREQDFSIESENERPQ